MKAPSLDRIRALEALLRTRSPAGAAAELGVTPYTAARALEQLRSELNDQLLMQRGDQMILTRRAEQLVDSLGETLGALDRLLEDEGKHARRATAAIAMSDEFVLALAPALVRRIAAESPQTTLKLLPYEHDRLAQDLARHAIDVAVAADPPSRQGLASTVLYQETYVCITADRAPLTLDRYLDAAHVATSSHAANTAIDLALARDGHRRKIVAHVPHLAALLQAVESQGFCATLPVRSALAMRPANLFIQPPPLPIPDRRVLLIWHRKCEQDPHNRWLRDTLISASKR
jgi:DNA-binding transcriptional LysR family regulator